MIKCILRLLRQPTASQPQKQPATRRHFNLNPFAFGGAGYVIGSDAHRLYRLLGDFYATNGVVPMTREELLVWMRHKGGFGITDTLIERGLDELLNPQEGYAPLLEISDGKIVPAKRFGLLKIHPNS